MGWNDEPVTITVAPCGAEVTRADNPALPHTPEEIARDAIASAEAGATILHIHVREPDGTPSSRLELFRETADRARAGSELVTMVSTGGAVWMSMEQRMQGMLAAPDLASLETGSLNFGEDLFATTFPQAREVIAKGRELGIGFEVEKAQALEATSVSVVMSTAIGATFLKLLISHLPGARCRARG